MAELPLDPLLAKCLVSSYKYDCFDPIVSIVALLSVPSIFVHPKGLEKKALMSRRKYSVKEGDHLSLLNIYNGFVESDYDSKWCQTHYFSYKILGQVVQVRHQLKLLMRKLASIMKTKDSENSKNQTDLEHVKIRKCLLEGFFSNVARLEPDGQSYRTLRGGSNLYIHPSSILTAYSPKWVMFHEVVETTKIFMREVSEIELDWLLEIAPHYYQLPTQLL